MNTKVNWDSTMLKTEEIEYYVGVDYSMVVDAENSTFSATILIFWNLPT